MTAAFTARKRAEEFNELIERASLDGLADTRYAELAAVLATLRDTAPVRPRADFSTDLRSRLMAAAETSLVPAAAAPAARSAEPTTGRSRRDKRIVAALGGFAIVTASASMAVAAQTALPGDTLYPLKRALENVHAGVQSGDDKGGTLLASASGRLKEVDELSHGGSQDPQVIAQTLQDFADQATEASAILLSNYQSTGSVESLQQLQSFTSSSMSELQALKDVVPDGARQMIFQAAQVLHQITEQALNACPTCSLDPLLSSAATTADDLTSASLPDLVNDILVPAPEPTQSAPSKPSDGGGNAGSSSTPPSSQPSSDPSAKPTQKSGSDTRSDTSSPSSTKSDDTSSSPVDPLTNPSDTSSSAPENGGNQPKDPVKHLVHGLTHGGVNSSGGGAADIVKGIKHTLHGTADDVTGAVDDLLGGATGT